MSEDMTIDRDGMAAEYVLGTLDPDERRAAQALLAQDAEFVAKVKLWERRLGELHLMVEPVEPDAHVWQRIKAKLPEPPPKPERKPEEVAIGAEPEPAIDLEPEHKPTLEPEAMRELEPPEPEPKPEIESKPEVERNHEVARKTAAEVNFESAIAAVESALASHGAASAAKSEAAEVAARQVPDAEPATAPSVDKTDRPAVSPAPTPPDSDLAVVPAAEAAGAADQQLRAAKRHLAGWRALALLLSLAVLAMAGLLALWKYAPDRLPPALQPMALMRLLGINVEAALPPRKPAPPESQYNE
jgi:anti-sigma-K factor RskA